MIPSFCPNAACKHHQAPQAGKTEWFVKAGIYITNTAGKVQRFSCKTCGQLFSEQTFSLDYMVKKKLPYPYIFERLKSSSGIRSISRDLKVSHKTILNRCFRLAHQAIAVHASLKKTLSLNEDLAADGFESFVLSQYYPNAIHLLVGAKSQFLYECDYAHIARKGRMTTQQKLKKSEIENSFVAGRRSISSSFSAIVEQIELLTLNRQTSSTNVFTDEKPQYAALFKNSAILEQQRKTGSFSHIQINSKKARTLHNPLFPVNYFDRELRKDCANHVRETMQFSKCVSNCMERIAIYRFHHNYIKPYRIDHPKLSKLLHAEVAGISCAAIKAELKTFFTERRFLSRVNLSWSDVLIWLKGYATLGRISSQYVPAFAWD